MEEGREEERPQKPSRKMETLTSDASAMRERSFSARDDARHLSLFTLGHPFSALLLSRRASARPLIYARHQKIELLAFVINSDEYLLSVARLRTRGEESAKGETWRERERGGGQGEETRGRANVYAALR